VEFDELRESLHANAVPNRKFPTLEARCPVCNAGVATVIKLPKREDPILTCTGGCSAEAIIKAARVHRQDAKRPGASPPSANSTTPEHSAAISADNLIEHRLGPSPSRNALSGSDGALLAAGSNAQANRNGQVAQPEVNLESLKLRLHHLVRGDIETAKKDHPEIVRGMTREAMIESAMTLMRYAVANKSEYRPPPLTESDLEEQLHSIALKTIETEFGPDRVDFAEKKNVDSAAEASQTAEWPDPISLDVAQLPELPKGLIAPWAEAMIVAVADATETPRELAAMMMLGTLAAATQRKCVVQVRPGYAEPLNIWPIVPLEPGNRKTSVLQAIAAPLRQWEREQTASLAPKIAEAESKRDTAKARIAALRAQAARAKGSADYADKSAEIARLESELPEVPKIQRLWAQDVTPEALGTLMFENDEAMGLISDEGGIFDILAGRYSNGVPNLDLFLQAHAGAPIRVDRGSRAPVMMDSPALTLVLSPQPDLLHGLASKPGFRGRGLLARFLYLLPPSRLGYRSGNTKPVPQSVSSDYTEHIRALLQLRRPEGGPHRIQVSNDALAEWIEFSATVETWMREGGRFENLRDWGGKLPGAAARIAGLFHCAEHALHMPHLELSLETMRRALEFAAILSNHALAAFDMMGADITLKDARKVWNWIQRERKPQFTFRDCFNALRGTFPRTAELERPFEVLAERSFLVPIESPARAGRRTRLYEVNPKLTEGWQR
jgi:hypothetical protein